MVPYMPSWIQNFDVNALNWIHNVFYDNPFCRWFFPIITHLGDSGIFWIVLSLLVFDFGVVGVHSKRSSTEMAIKSKKIMVTGLMMGLALLLGLILGNGLLKNLFMRVRPYELEGALVTASNTLAKIPHDTSFPSGHTLASFEASLVIFYYNKKIGIPFLLLASCIAFSRLYLYMHFPTDILFAIILAMINATLSIFIINKIISKIDSKKEQI